MKKKFISVAMFLALAVSSPVWVGCADYDDDIANLQSQVDGLKSSVEVSKSEALQALEQAQAALQADIDELTAGKADEQAVKDLQATVADLQTALDNNDITAAGELAQKVNDLVEQVNAIPTELEGVRDDLNTQKEELQGNIDALQGELNTLKEQMANAATEEDVAAIQTKSDEEIMPKLEQATADIVEINNKLTEIEPWIEQNGEELAKLTANVTKINNLINTISQETAETISDPAILAAIQNLPSDTNDSLRDLQNQIDALEQQLQGQGGETGEGEGESLLSRLEALEQWKDAVLLQLVETGNYTSFKDLCEDIVALQVALNGNPEDLENNPGLIAQYNELKAQMAKFDMIQSVVYLPKWDSEANNGNGAVREYLLESSQLTVKDKNGKKQTLTQKIDNNTIQFRVSPASKAKEFIGDNPRYVLSFDGQQLSKAFDKVTVDGAAKLVDEAAGIIEYKVKTNLEAGDVWAVCAVITSQDVKDAEGEVTTPADGTNLSTTYFMAKQTSVDIDYVKVTVEDENGDNASTANLKMPYKNGDGSASSIDFAKTVKVEGWKTGELSATVEDLVAEYGVPSLTYELNTLADKDTSNDNWFTINNGVLTIPGEGTNIMIGREVTVTIKPNFNFELPTTTVNATAKVTITARTFDYEVPGTKQLMWNPSAKVYALTDEEISNFVLNTHLQSDDLAKLVADDIDDWSKPVFTTGEKIHEASSTLSSTLDLTKVENKPDKYYIFVPAQFFTDKTQPLTLKLKMPRATGTTQTDTDTYTLKVNVSAVDFGVKEIAKNTTFWPADNKVTYTPLVSYLNNDIKTDVVTSVGNTIDIKQVLIANYDKIKEAGGELVVEAENKNALKGGVTLVANSASNTYTVTYEDLTTANDGEKVIKLKMYVKYNTSAGVKTFGEVKCEISPRTLSGTWHNPSSLNQEAYDLSQSPLIGAGATWVDFRGKKMWDGSDPNYKPDAQDKNKNYINGFNKADALGIYGLQAPEFHLLGADGKPVSETTYGGATITENDFIRVNVKTGQVTYKDKALAAPFARDESMKIRISVNSKWGLIEGIPGDYVDVTFTIKKDASTNYGSKN